MPFGHAHVSRKNMENGQSVYEYPEKLAFFSKHGKTGKGSRTGKGKTEIFGFLRKILSKIRVKCIKKTSKKFS